MADSAGIIYRVNDQDKIVFVNAKWDQLAAANAGEAVTASQVLQRRLWDFISDSTTRELYRQVLLRIRDGRSLRFTFRCDSPSCRRLLEMDVHSREDGTVEFRTRTVSEESRQPLVLQESGAAGSGELLRMCGWCKKVFFDGTWTEVEDAVDQLRLFHRTFLPSITHGICEGCYQEMIKTLANA
ncbi:MAG: hypothetical protein ACKV22_36225 [Bryobacteraceae bacterium]